MAALRGTCAEGRLAAGHGHAQRVTGEGGGPLGRQHRAGRGGLRLLTGTSDGTMYLLPRQWRHGIDPVYVLPPGAPIRLEIVATPDDV